MSTVKCYHPFVSCRYCSHVVKDEINDCTTQLLTDLVRFQDRQYQKDPIKAKAKRRYVCGLREVTKHLKLRKLKCVIVPPNLDKIQSTGQFKTIRERMHLLITVTNIHRGVYCIQFVNKKRLYILIILYRDKEREMVQMDVLF